MDRGARRHRSPAAGPGRSGCPRAMPRGSGTPAPAGPGCGSRSTRPPTRGRTRGAPRAGSTCTTAPATAGAPARPRPAGSTSSPRHGHLRTAWAALIDVGRTTPATRTSRRTRRSRTCCAVCAPPGTAGRRRRCSSSTPATAPPPSPTGSWLPVARPGPARRRRRPLRRSPPWQGRYGRPARRGLAVHCLEPAGFTAGAGHGPRGRKKPLPPNPEPGETLTLPDTPLYGTIPPPRPGTACAPSSTAIAARSPAPTHLPVLRGTLIPGPPGARVPHLSGILGPAARPAPCPAGPGPSCRAPRSTRGPRGHPRPPSSSKAPAGRTASPR